MHAPDAVEHVVVEPVREDRFPHDRVVFFCDAVFAIVITLLAIELRLPSKELIAQVGADAAGGETVSLFISFVVSFLVTGLFWMGHMQTWKHVTRINGRLVWLALLQLMFVALMPFATRGYSESFSGLAPGRFAFYALVLTAISLFSLLARLVIIKQEHLREKIGVAQTQWLLWRGVISFIIFAAAIPLSYVLPVWSAAFVFMLIFPVSRIAKRCIFARRNHTSESSDTN